MPHFCSDKWNFPCGTVFQVTKTAQAIPTGTVSSTTIPGTTYTAQRRGLYRVDVYYVFTTAPTSGTFTPQIVSQDDTHTVTNTMGLAGASNPTTNSFLSSSPSSTTVGNHGSASKSAYVVLKNGGTLNLAYTTTSITGSQGLFTVYMHVTAI
jgi:hypothetical protein